MAQNVPRYLGYFLCEIVTYIVKNSTLRSHWDTEWTKMGAGDCERLRLCLSSSYNNSRKKQYIQHAVCTLMLHTWCEDTFMLHTWCVDTFMLLTWYLHMIMLHKWYVHTFMLRTWCVHTSMLHTYVWLTAVLCISKKYLIKGRVSDVP